MIAVLIFCLSALIATVTFLKSKEKHTYKSYFGENTELLKYFDLKYQEVPNAILLKNILNAAVSLEQRKYGLSEEKRIASPLHKNRILGLESWNELERSEKDLEIEEKEIEAEAEELKKGYSIQIFKDAKKAFWKNKNLVDERNKKEMVRKSKDGLFQKKKEVLTRELLRNLKAGLIVNKY